jgi:hypothetical protein
MTTKSKELFDFLSVEYTDSVFDDLELCTPTEKNNNTMNFNGKEHLKDENFVCCEQKLIYWDKDGYLIICLYNNHPNVKYETKEEVKDFLMGNNQAIKSYPYLSYPNSEGETEESKAHNDGLFCYLYQQMCGNSGLQEFKKNAFIVSGLGEQNVTLKDNVTTDDVVNRDLSNLNIYINLEQ